MNRLIILAFLLSAAPACAQDSPARLLPLSGLKFGVERLGTFTYLHCEDATRPDCALFERLQTQPDVDWDALIAKAGKPRRRRLAGPLPVLAKVNVDDQHGGPWTIALLPPHNGRKAPFLGELTYVVVPDFPGYRLQLGDKEEVISVDVVADRAQWQKAMAAQPRKKTGLEKLLE